MSLPVDLFLWKVFLERWGSVERCCCLRISGVFDLFNWLGMRFTRGILQVICFCFKFGSLNTKSWVISRFLDIHFQTKQITGSNFIKCCKWQHNYSIFSALPPHLLTECLLASSVHSNQHLLQEYVHRTGRSTSPGSTDSTLASRDTLKQSSSVVVKDNVIRYITLLKIPSFHTSLVVRSLTLEDPLHEINDKLDIFVENIWFFIN